MSLRQVLEYGTDSTDKLGLFRCSKVVKDLPLVEMRRSHAELGSEQTDQNLARSHNTRKPLESLPRRWTLGNRNGHDTPETVYTLHDTSKIPFHRGHV